MQQKISGISIDDDETVFSLDVKSLYINLPVKEVIDHACDSLYVSQFTQEMENSVSKKLMELAVLDVQFMARRAWFII